MKILVGLLLVILGVATAQEAAPLEVLGETAEYRVIRHFGGETRIPASPQRVVTLGNWITDPLLALGVTLAGTVSYFGVDDVPPYAEAQLEGVPRVGTWETPNLEAILTSEPDLILAGSFLKEGFGAQLERIAPTVYLEGSVTDPREQLRDMGRLLGLGAAAETRVAEYDAALDQAKQALGDKTDLRAAFMRVRASDLRLYGGSSSIATLLYDELGFARAPLVETVLEEEWQVPISGELIPELGADVLFYAVEDEARFDELSTTPLWQNVPAVREGRAFGVPIYFYFGSAPADEYAVEMLLEFLGESE